MRIHIYTYGYSGYGLIPASNRAGIGLTRTELRRRICTCIYIHTHMDTRVRVNPRKHQSTYRFNPKRVNPTYPYMRIHIYTHRNSGYGLIPASNRAGIGLTRTELRRRICTYIYTYIHTWILGLRVNPASNRAGIGLTRTELRRRICTCIYIHTHMDTRFRVNPHKQQSRYRFYPYRVNPTNMYKCIHMHNCGYVLCCLLIRPRAVAPPYLAAFYL